MNQILAISFMLVLTIIAISTIRYAWKRAIIYRKEQALGGEK
jgi:hypothetical protein